MDELLSKFKRARKLDCLSVSELIQEFLACAAWDEDLRRIIESPGVIYLAAADLRKYSNQVDKNTDHLNHLKTALEENDHGDRTWSKTIFHQGTMQAKLRVIDEYVAAFPLDAKVQIGCILERFPEGERYHDTFKSSLNLVQRAT